MVKEFEQFKNTLEFNQWYKLPDDTELIVPEHYFDVPTRHEGIHFVNIPCKALYLIRTSSDWYPDALTIIVVPHSDGEYYHVHYDESYTEYLEEQFTFSVLFTALKACTLVRLPKDKYGEVPQKALLRPLPAIEFSK